MTNSRKVKVIARLIHMYFVNNIQVALEYIKTNNKWGDALCV